MDCVYVCILCISHQLFHFLATHRCAFLSPSAFVSLNSSLFFCVTVTIKMIPLPRLSPAPSVMLLSRYVFIDCWDVFSLPLFVQLLSARPDWSAFCWVEFCSDYVNELLLFSFIALVMALWVWWLLALRCYVLWNTMHHAPCTMHYAPCTMHHAPFTMHHSLYTMCCEVRYTMHHALCTMKNKRHR